MSAALVALYSELPKLDCKRLCQESCGPLLMSQLEWSRVCESHGSEPRIGPDLTCPLLVNGECSVYMVRPLICRLWGLVKKLACPHGCTPERWLTDYEASRFLQRAKAIGGEPNGTAIQVLDPEPTDVISETGSGGRLTDEMRRQLDLMPPFRLPTDRCPGCGGSGKLLHFKVCGPPTVTGCVAICPTKPTIVRCGCTGEGNASVSDG